MAAAGVVQLKGIAYVELYVANAYQATFFYRSALGFTPTAVLRPKSGDEDRTSVLMEQGAIRLLLTSGVGSESAVARHVHEHGDTVRDVAFLVDDAAAAFATARSRGARTVMAPTTVARSNDNRGMIKATIGAPGDTVHSFVQFTQPIDDPWPGFERKPRGPRSNGIGLIDIDHVAVGLDAGSLDSWVDFYKSVLGFRQSHAEMIWTSRSGMNSKVVQDEDAHVRIPMVEPAGDGRTSQIDDYLSHHGGAGAQHVAFGTRDVAATIEALQARGVRCLSIPRTYYEDLRARIPDLDPAERSRFEAAGVLVDSEDDGLLLQAFTEPLHHRPTLFVELIERRGAKGFGGRNIQALFEAVERDRLENGMAAD
jgi:4-hydroxyphenylpyruvate dioxygenase